MKSSHALTVKVIDRNSLENSTEGSSDILINIILIILKPFL